MNPIWIYANDSYFQLFATTAWETGWLYQYEVEETIYWYCDGTCTTCIWPGGGNWEVQTILYGKPQLVQY